MTVYQGPADIRSPDGRLIDRVSATLATRHRGWGGTLWAEASSDGVARWHTLYAQRATIALHLPSGQCGQAFVTGFQPGQQRLSIPVRSIGLAPFDQFVP